MGDWIAVTEKLDPVSDDRRSASDRRKSPLMGWAWLLAGRRLRVENRGLLLTQASGSSSPMGTLPL